MVGEVDALLGVLAIGDVFAKFVYLGLNIRLRRIVGRGGGRNGLFDFYLFTLSSGALVSLTGRKGSEGKGKEKKKKFVHGVGKLGANLWCGESAFALRVSCVYSQVSCR